MKKKSKTYLCIHGRIPVRIIKDYSVRSGQIHSYSSWAGGQNEHKELRVGVESLHQYLPLFWLGGAVQPQVCVSIQIEEHFQDIQHFGHLGEDEGFVATRFQCLKENCQLLGKKSNDFKSTKVRLIYCKSTACFYETLWTGQRFDLKELWYRKLTTVVLMARTSVSNHSHCRGRSSLPVNKNYLKSLLLMHPSLSLP